MRRVRRPLPCKAGLGLVPEERRAEGLILSKSVAFNVGLANLQKLVVSSRPAADQWKAPQAALARDTIRALSIKTPRCRDAGRAA